MNAVMESLVEVVQADPTPEPHTSSYWKQYSQGFVVRRQGEELVLQSNWTFGSFGRTSA